MSNLFVQNRKKLAKQLNNNSLLILFAGNAPVKRGDEFYPFSPQRNFYYATGIDRPGLIFTMYKKDDNVIETLYLERFDELKAKWNGAALSVEEATKISGLDNTKWLDEFDVGISGTLFYNNPDLYLDLENRSLDISQTPDLVFANRIKTNYPALKIINAYPVFASLRMIKSKDELKYIQKAVNITRDAICEMMRNAKPGMREYEIEAYFDFVLKKNGVKDRAFASIAASGKNAAILHYSENNAKTNDGDLILFDVGAQCGYYSADITRTFPVNGKFSERQKTLYNIVLEAHKKVINSIKPGVPFKNLNEIVKSHYSKELKKIGLIENKEDVSKYYYHGVSHFLGLETHDIGRGNEQELEKGMVITVEPGLYIAEEGIGIRIEDNVYVTGNGSQILSGNIVRTVEDIEALMGGA